jgi:hypothetical protein
MASLCRHARVRPSGERGAGIHAFRAKAKAWMAGPKSGHDVNSGTRAKCATLAWNPAVAGMTMGRSRPQ